MRDLVLQPAPCAATGHATTNRASGFPPSPPPHTSRPIPFSSAVGPSSQALDVSPRMWQTAQPQWHAGGGSTPLDSTMAVASHRAPGHPSWSVTCTGIAIFSALLLAAPGAAEAASLTDAVQAVQAYAASNTGPSGVAAFIAAYGPLAGTAVVSVASTLGAMASFTIARTAARPWVEGRLEGSPQVKAVISGVSKEGARLVLLLRLSPLVPFTLLNYALGLTEVGFGQYALASWAGMLPGTFAYVFLGGAGRAALDTATAAGDSSGPDPARLVLWGVGLVATLLATKLVSNAASKALQTQTPE